jgi:hypothetical protein
VEREKISFVKKGKSNFTVEMFDRYLLNEVIKVNVANYETN